ncbi:tripartite tricarboxylate transporter substrate binding protein [Ralstonia sp. GX3-BWBA]|uniref:Bug family tripartite tricarboxylate transporter substrate binding protein n=1 Tax=Ralstonia sp. GX3-BWBA TaxID=2219865 RepID=UPI000DD3D13D|nr:tripartite tricarboxylate transporter substrate binding protein [Ralstonia sp. GX3-BWBA]
MKNSRLHFALIATVCATAAACQPALAQGGYPTKPVTIVVAYPAGGDADALARLIADKLSARVGQPVLVDNRPGASGIIGTAHVAKAAPDGYTLLLAPSTFSIAQFVVTTSPGTRYDVMNGFTPIIQTGSQSLALIAGPGTTAKTVPDIIAKARLSGGLGYATPGSGSPMHIAGELFNKAAGIKLNHVPYKGVAPAINDVLGGHVPITFITLGPVLPYLSTGKLVPVALADSERSPLAPNVPTLRELGYKDTEVKAWTGLFGPRGLPRPVVDVLNMQVNAILKDPDTVAKLAAIGMLPAGGKPEQLEKINAADFSRYGKLIQELNIRAE